ncbi:hypothetical protein LTR08_003698 [Meristemomyces frigidus]|nr:hypothetical protein LTR08_003698 [Meristemomyces frigidus]
MDENRDTRPPPPPTPKPAHRRLPTHTPSRPSSPPDSPGTCGGKPVITFPQILPGTGSLPETQHPRQRANDKDGGWWPSSPSRSPPPVSPPPVSHAKKKDVEEAVYDEVTGFLIKVPYETTENPHNGFLTREVASFVPTPRKPMPQQRESPRIRSPPQRPRRVTQEGKGKAALGCDRPPKPWLVLPNRSGTAKPFSVLNSAGPDSPPLWRGSYGEIPLSRKGIRHARDSTPAPGTASSSVKCTPVFNSVDPTRMVDLFARPGSQSCFQKVVLSIERSEKPERARGASPPYEPSPSLEHESVRGDPRKGETTPTQKPKSAQQALPVEGPMPSAKSSRHRGRSQERRPSGSSSTTSAVPARRHRSQTPVFLHGLIGHGHTTYMPVPEDPADRKRLVIDETQVRPGKRERRQAGTLPLMWGSKNGHYLEEFKLQQGLLELHPNQTTEQLESWEDERRSSKEWHDAMIRRTVQAGTSSTWMNETWGPAIKDKYGEPVQPSLKSGHPSNTGTLGPQYSGGPMKHKRSNSGLCPDSLARKKLRKHALKLTLPGLDYVRKVAERMGELRAEEDQEERERASPKRPILHVRQFLAKANTFCSVCEATEHIDGGPLNVCANCEINAYCSRECKEKHAGWHSKTCKSSERSDKHVLLFDTVTGGLGGLPIHKPTELGGSEVEGAQQWTVDGQPGSTDENQLPGKPELSILDDPASHDMDDPIVTDNDQASPWSSITSEVAAAMKSMSERFESRFAFGQDGGGSNAVSAPKHVRAVSADVAEYFKNLNKQYGKPHDSNHGDRDLVDAEKVPSKEQTLAKQEADRKKRKADRKKQMDKLMQQYHHDDDEYDEAWYEKEMQQSSDDEYHSEDTAPVKRSNERVLDPGLVIWHRVANYRMMEYLIEYPGCTGWCPAELLCGEEWVQALAKYWLTDNSVRYLVCIDDQHEAPYEPGRCGRFIRSAKLCKAHQSLRFDIRDCQRFEDPNSTQLF